MTDSLTAHPTAATTNETDKRRGSRLTREVAITVMGIDSLGDPFRETTITSSISCYGCKYHTRRYADKNSPVTLEIRRPAGFGNLRDATRLVHARVVWVQRPRNHRETFQIALELESPGNVWGVDPPPGDWFPCAEDLERREAVREATHSVAQAAAAPEAPQNASPTSAADASSGGVLARLPFVSQGEKPCPDEKSPVWETLTLPEKPAHPAPLGEASQEAVSRAVKMTAEALIAEEVALVRKHFSGRLEAALLETLKTFSDLTAEIVNETRRACRASVAEMEAELQHGLRERSAKSGSPEAEPTAPTTKKRSAKPRKKKGSNG